MQIVFLCWLFALFQSNKCIFSHFMIWNAGVACDISILFTSSSAWLSGVSWSEVLFDNIIVKLGWSEIWGQGTPLLSLIQISKTGRGWWYVAATKTLLYCHCLFVINKATASYWRATVWLCDCVTNHVDKNHSPASSLTLTPPITHL